jgi:hypothetical protein
MAIALVSQNDATGASTSPAVTLSVTSGNLLVFCWVTRNGTGTHNSLADSQTQTWTQAGTPVAVDGYASVWYCQNTFTGSLTVTGTLSGSDTWYVNLSEWSGQHASSPYVSTDSHPFSTSTTHVFGDTGISVTTGQLLIGCATQGASITDEVFDGSFPFTALQFTNSTNVRQWWGYRIAAGTESNVQGNWTQTSSSAAGRMAKFDQASAGVTTEYVGPTTEYLLVSGMCGLRRL